jgi:hypothetical protein
VLRYLGSQTVEPQVLVQSSDDWLVGRKEIAMYVCQMCHFEVELDDVLLPSNGGRCVCLGSYLRANGQWQPVPKSVREEVIAILTTIVEPV